MDKRTLLAFLFIALILMLMPYYYRIVGLAEPEEKEAPALTAPAEKTKQARSPDVSTQPKIEKSGDDITPSSEEVSVPVDMEKFFHVKTDLYTATVSSRAGGTLTSFVLNDYLIHNGEHVNLINQGGNSENLLIQYQNLLGESVILDRPFSVEETGFLRDPIEVGPEGFTLSFKTGAGGRTVTKSLTFHQNTYLIDIYMDLSLISEEEVSQERFMLRWDGGLPFTEKNKIDDAREFTARLYQGKTDEKIKHKEKPMSVSGTGQTSWASIRSKYFIAAYIPIDESNYGEIFANPYNPQKQGVIYPPKYGMSLGFSSNQPIHCSLYLGPLKYKFIRSLGIELERSMSLGPSILRPISRGVLFLLTSMHKIVPNYGVLLIIFSVLVKIVVYPLTKKSYQSTKEMQAVQPLIMGLREKYKGDPQKLNKATMSLYKEHGVNPLGGCLPMLLQMPLLFALFIVFRTTIELRQAPFIWWINDLSSPDALIPLPFTLPLYGNQISILPLLMGVSMFLQQKMMGTQTSGQQKYMSYFMTGFFLLIFNQFPSGLNLYYTLFNVLTILQQKYLVSPTKKVAPAPSVPSKRKR